MPISGVVIPRARLKLCYTLSAMAVERFRLPELEASDRYIVGELVKPRLMAANQLHGGNKVLLSQYLAKQQCESEKIVGYWRELVARVTKYYDEVFLDRELPAALLLEWLDTKWLAAGVSLEGEVAALGERIRQSIECKRACDVGFGYAEADEVSVQRESVYQSLKQMFEYAHELLHLHMLNVCLERQRHAIEDPALRAQWAKLEKKGKS